MKNQFFKNKAGKLLADVIKRRMAKMLQKSPTEGDYY